MWATAAMAGEPPVPIEGKLLVGGWQSYFLEGSSGNVTVAPARFHQGDISPLGDQVVYHEQTWVPSIHLPPGEVWKAAIDGSNAVNLTGPLGLGGISCQPLWSPDASRIAFIHSDPAPGQYPCYAGFHTWVMNADGTVAHQVNPPGSPPDWLVSWSPDGYRLLCDVTGDGSMPVGSMTIDIDGTDMEQVP
jgi:hypothetical protein